MPVAEPRQAGVGAHVHVQPPVVGIATEDSPLGRLQIDEPAVGGVDRIARVILYEETQRGNVVEVVGTQRHSVTVGLQGHVAETQTGACLVIRRLEELEEDLVGRFIEFQ